MSFKSESFLIFFCFLVARQISFAKDTIDLQIVDMLPKSQGKDLIYNDDLESIQRTSLSALQKQSNQRGNLKRRKMGITNEYRIQHVSINPFELVIGPTKHPLNLEQVGELKEIIVETLIKNIPQKITARNDQLLDVKLAGYRMEYRGSRRHRHLNRNTNRFMNDASYESHTTIFSMEGGEAEFGYSPYPFPPKRKTLNNIVIDTMNNDLLHELKTTTTFAQLNKASAYSYKLTNPSTSSPTFLKDTIYWNTESKPNKPPTLSSNDDNNNAESNNKASNNVNYILNASNDGTQTHPHHSILVAVGIVCSVAFVAAFAIKKHHDFTSRNNSQIDSDYTFGRNEFFDDNGDYVYSHNRGKIAHFDSQQHYDTNSIDEAHFGNQPHYDTHSIGKVVMHPSQSPIAATASTTNYRQDELHDLFTQSIRDKNHDRWKETASVSTDSMSQQILRMRSESFEFHRTLDTTYVEKEMLNTSSPVSAAMKARREESRRSSTLLATEFSASSLLKESQETRNQFSRLQVDSTSKGRSMEYDDTEDDFSPDVNWDPNDNDTDEIVTSPPGSLC